MFKENYLTGESVELDLNDYIVTDKTTEQWHREQRKKALEKKAIIEARADYPFVWALYSGSSLLLQELSGSHVSMAFLLATYCDYDGFLSTGKAPVQKEQLEKLLGVSRSTAWRFWETVSNLEIFEESEDKRILVNDEYFRRGKIKKSEFATMSAQNKFVTRLYIHAIRSLYEKATSSSIKSLCYLFQIIPYLNREYNIICHNPLEEKLELLKPMNLGEFCRTVGYDENNSSRLLSALIEPKFKNGNKAESAMRYVISSKLRDKSSYNLFVNPNVYYAGTRWDEVKVLGQF